MYHSGSGAGTLRGYKNHLVTMFTLQRKNSQQIIRFRSGSKKVTVCSVLAYGSHNREPDSISHLIKPQLRHIVISVQKDCDDSPVKRRRDLVMISSAFRGSNERRRLQV